VTPLKSFFLQCSIVLLLFGALLAHRILPCLIAELMREGGRAKLTIPSRLGFAEKAIGMIPPYSTLVYEIELVEVVS